jgi:hypothetical protein
VGVAAVVAKRDVVSGKGLARAHGRGFLADREMRGALDGVGRRFFASKELILEGVLLDDVFFKTPHPLHTLPSLSKPIGRFTGKKAKRRGSRLGNHADSA